MGLNIDDIRASFPILNQAVNGKPLVYLDNAATTQKPDCVINRISHYYQSENSNIHRGVHHLSQVATEAYEGAREYVSQFINAVSSREIIFTKGTTDSVNLLATLFYDRIKEGDEIVVSAMEHHSNLVPWQQLCERKRANLVIIPVTDSGELEMGAFEKLLTGKTKLVAIAHISNVLGTINPVAEIVRLAHEKNIPVFVDGAQAVAHVKVDVSALDCDFYAFSAHKAYGPMGTGVLYGKEEWLQQLPPGQFGGEMVDTVSFEKTVFNVLPFKYEAGTPNVAGVLGMEEALRFIERQDIEQIKNHEDDLLEYAGSKLLEIDGLRIIGTAKDKTAVVSFVVEGLHPYDIGTLLDQMGIAVRTGHHCAQPLIDSFGLPGTVRASLAVYNNKNDVDALADAAKKAITMLR